jgi:tRNA G18 (ribose-2'-O)-methylase SpoU
VASRSSAPDRRGRSAGAGVERGRPARGAAEQGARPRTKDGHDDDLGSGLDLIYGRNPVREALRGRRRVHTVLLATGEAGDELEGALRGWWSGPPNSMPPVDRVSPTDLSARLRTSEHQSIAAVVDPYP